MNPPRRHIFISYANEDGPRVKVLADALTASGWKVWWDREIPFGKDYQQVIETALDEAACAIVVWSSHSVASTWVKAEAEAARERQVLFPVAFEPVKVPVVFRVIQTADLSDWKGDRDAPEFRKLVRDISKVVPPDGATESVATPPPPPPPRPEPTPVPQPAPRPQRRYSPWSIGIAAIGLVGVLAVGGRLLIDHLSAPPPTLEIAGIKLGTQTPPELDISTPAEGAVIEAGEVTVSGYVFDDDETFVYVNGEAATVEGRQWSKTLTATGNPLTVRVIAEDGFGNRSEAIERVYEVTSPRDTDPPVLAIERPAGDDRIEVGPVTLEGTVNDAGPVSVTVDGRPAEVSGRRWSYQTEVAPGIRDFVIRAVDEAGNASLPLRHTLHVESPPDRLAPEVTLDFPPAGTRLVEGTISLLGTFSDDSPATVEVNGRSAQLQNGRWMLDLDLPAGTQTIRVEAHDEAGNSAPPLVLTLDVQPRSLLGLLPESPTLAMRIASVADLWRKLRGSLLGPVVNLALDEARHDFNQMGIDPDRLLESIQGEVAVWLDDLAWRQGRPESDLAQLRAILVGDTRDGIGAFERVRRRFVQAAEANDRRFRLDELALEGGRHFVFNFENGAVRVHLAIRGGRFFLTTNPDLLSRTLRRDRVAPTPTPSGPLARLLDHPDGASDDLALLFGLENIERQLLPDGPPAPLTGDDPQKRARALRQAEENARLKRAAHILRKSSWRMARLGLSFERERIEASMLLGGQRPFDGLLRILDVAPLDKMRLGVIHAPGDIFVGLAADLARAVRVFNAVVGTLQDESQDLVERIIEKEFRVDARPSISKLGEQLHVFVQGDLNARDIDHMIVADTLGVAVGIDSHKPITRALKDMADRELLSATTTPGGKTLWSHGADATIGFGDAGQLLLYGNRPEVVMEARRRLSMGTGELPGELYEALPEQINGVFYCRGPLAQSLLREMLELDRPGPASRWQTAWLDVVAGTGSLLGHTRWIEGSGYLLKASLLGR